MLAEDDIKALRAAAGDRPVPMLVSEMLDYAIRSYNACADEEVDQEHS